MLICKDCQGFFHRSCLGLSHYAYPGAVFRCADCLLWEAKIPSHPEALHLAAEVVHLAAARLADSTDRAYHSAINCSKRFLLEVLHVDIRQGLPTAPGAVVPDGLVQLFLAHARHHYSISSLELTLTALNNYHRSRGLQHTVYSIEVQGMMQALKTAKSQQQDQPQPEAGITPQIFQLLFTHLQQLYSEEAQNMHGLIFLRDRVAFALGYYGLLRRSEIISLQARDVKINSLPGKGHYVEISIRKSKTDQRGQGAQVCLAPISRHHIDLLSLFNQWSSVLSSLDPSPSAAFIPAFDKEGNTFQGQLKNGQALATRLRWYIKQLDARFPFLGLKPQLFAMHSFRRGGTTNAWECGVDRALLKIHFFYCRNCSLRVDSARTVSVLG